MQATDGKALLDTGVIPGSIDDFANRLRSLLPIGWFPAPPQGLEEEQAPVLVAMLRGFASVLAGIWTLAQDCESQMRLSDMSGGFLDMAAEDYFGSGELPRQTQESDSAYHARIVSSLIATKNTRRAVRDALLGVTGVEPVLIEPQNASDCHAFGTGNAPALGGGYGYGCAGLRYGSLQGGQFFVETGMGSASGREAVLRVIEQTKAIGVTGWVRMET